MSTSCLMLFPVGLNFNAGSALTMLLPLPLVVGAGSSLFLGPSGVDGMVLKSTRRCGRAGESGISMISRAIIRVAGTR